MAKPNQQHSDFIRDGVLKLRLDDHLVNALSELRGEARHALLQLENSSAHQEQSSWDDCRGWGDVHTKSKFICEVLSGTIGDLVCELLAHPLTNGKPWSNSIQFSYTKPVEGRFVREEIFNEHRDGAMDPNQKSIHLYKIQLGILLEDVNESDGPFVYWPGSHHFAVRHAEENPNASAVKLIRTDLKLRESAKHCKFIGKAGDVILSHPLVTHGTLLNRGHKIRPMLFARVGSNSDTSRGIFDEPWKEFPRLEQKPQQS